MAIKLKWTNPNQFAVTLEIYRGLSPLDRANLSNPLVTLSGGETSWIDATALFDTKYYYVFVTLANGDRVVSNNIPVETTEHRGAGPNILKYGDERYGYYGKLLASEFLTGNQVLEVAKSMVGMPTSIAEMTWHKFVRNGKVLYVPHTGWLYPSSWDALYKAGFVYGVDGPGPDDGRGALAPVNQKAVVQFAGDEYIVRLPLGFKDKPTDTPDYSPLPTAAGNAVYLDLDDKAYREKYNEFNDLFYPLFTTIPNLQRLENLIQQNVHSVMGQFSSGYYVGNICQERKPGTDFVLMRAHSMNSGEANQPYPRWCLSAAKFVPAAGGSQSSLHVGRWWPIIELVAAVNITL